MGRRRGGPRALGPGRGAGPTARRPGVDTGRRARRRAGSCARRGSESGAPGPVAGPIRVLREPRRAHPPESRADRHAGRLRLRPHDFRAAAAPSGASLDARDLRADLRDLQDLPDHAGQVHPAARAVHRRRHRPLLRRAAAVHGDQGRGHPVLQPDRHRRQLRCRLVRHPHQYVRQLTDRVCQSRGQALSALRHPAQGRDEHRHAAHLGRAVPDALHPAVRARRLRRRLLHRLRHRRVARRGGASHRWRHLHQDRRHRLRPDEDRLQHQGRRRAQPRRDRRLHRRQRRRLGRPLRRRLRDLRRHRRGAHHVHHAGRAGPDRAGPAAGLDLHDARRDGHRQRRFLPGERGHRARPLRRRPDDELRAAADAAGLADVAGVDRDDLRRLEAPDSDAGRRQHAVVEAGDGDHLRHVGGRGHPGAGQNLHFDRVVAREGSRLVIEGGRGVAQHPVGAGRRQLQRLLARDQHRRADVDRRCSRSAWSRSASWGWAR
jgi:hypothetical protein